MKGWNNLGTPIEHRPMSQSPDNGADEWRCESYIYYPPSSFGGKPCSYCWEGDPYLDQYVPGDGAEKEEK